jgi:hypothetical protein
MKEPPPGDDEHNPLSAWVRDHYEDQVFYTLAKNEGGPVSLNPPSKK